MTDYSLLNHSVAPPGVSVNTWAADPSQYRFGTKIQAVNFAGVITAVWVYIPDTSWSGVTSEVYVRRAENLTETDQIAPYRTQSFVGRATPGWQKVTLSSPYTLNVDEVVTVAYKRVTNTSYVTHPDMLAGDDVFSADEAMKAPTSVWNGVYSTSTDVNDPIRTVYNDGTWYGVDVAFTVVSPLGADAGNDIEMFSGDQYTLVAVGSGGSESYTYSWDKLSGPSCTLIPSNTASTVFKPTGGVGTYTLRVTVNDGVSTTTDNVTVSVIAPPPSVPVTPTTTTGWTVSGAANASIALSDSDSASYLESAQNPSTQPLLVTLSPMSKPDADLVIEVDLSAVDASFTQFTATLRDGSTVLSSSSPLSGITSSVERRTVRFLAANISTINSTKWASGTLTVQFSASATT